MSNIMRLGGGGADLSVITAIAADVLAGKVIVDSNGNALTGTIASKAAATITPGTTDQTIASGQYLSGVQTISGDADLVAANILSTANIFGVQGSVPVIANTESGTTGQMSSATIAITLAKPPIAFFAIAYSGSSPYTAFGAAIKMPNGTFYKVFENPSGGNLGVTGITYSNNIVTVTTTYSGSKLKWFAWEVA